MSATMSDEDEAKNPATRSQSRSIQEPMQMSRRCKQMVWTSEENKNRLYAEAWRSGHDHPSGRFQGGGRGVEELDFHRVARRRPGLSQRDDSS